MGRAHEVRAKAMAATAAKKSKLYSIYAKEIMKAAKGNPDPTSNDVLRRIIEKAKREQVPADVINRNIDKAKKGEVENFDVVEYEAFAQGGSNLIVKCLTDNPNRTISFVKTVFNKCGAKIAGQNAVSFMYEHLGATSSYFTSPHSLFSALRFIPTSITIAPSFTISAVTKRALPIATTRISASLVTSARLCVLEWQTVTVPFA